MPQFNYSARDPTGKIISETLSATSIEEASNILRAQRYQILKLKQKTKREIGGKSLSGSLSVIDKANLCRYLATMIGAGLPITEAISTITRDTTNKTLKGILVDIQNSLQQGESLSDTFARHPQFDKVFVTIIKAGEQSGSVQQSFKYLEQQLMATHNLSQKVKGALIYPAVIISTMFGVGGILILFVVPQIAQVFLTSDFPVPKLTTIVLQGGLALRENLAIIGAGLVISIVGLIIALKTTSGKNLLLRIIKSIPGISGIFEKLDLSRFSRTLATLMHSGVPITQSLAVSTVTLSQSKFAPLAKALQVDVKKGQSISAVLRAHPEHIPQTMISMIATGEKTGTLDTILFDVAKFYEEELENAVKNFTAILEPVIMLIIGIGVGGMVLSVIAPIYSLVSNLQTLQ